MMTMGRTVRAIPWCGFLLLAAAQASAGECTDWQSREYFKTATLPQVRECLAANPGLQAHGGPANPPLHEAAWATPHSAVIAALLGRVERQSRNNGSANRRRGRP